MADARISRDTLIEQVRPRLLFLARRRGISPQDSEDVVQETLLTALDQISRGVMPAEGKTGPWLEAILRGKIADYWRRHVRRERIIAAAPAETYAEDERSMVEQQTGRQEDSLKRLEFEQALSRLKPRHRIAIVLFEVQGIPADEIARRLGWPRGTVFRILFEARRQLAEYFRSGEDLAPVRRQLQQRDQTGEKT